MHKIPKKTYLRNPFQLLGQLDEESFDKLPSWLKDIIDLGQDLDDLKAGDFEEQIDYYVNAFRRDQYAFVRKGLLAYKFKHFKAYKRLGCKSFEKFCKKVFGLSHWQVDREIKATRTFLTLVLSGFDIFPKNVNQAEKIMNFGEEDLIENWQTIIESMEPHQITGTSIRQLLYTPTEDDRAMKKMNIPGHDFEKLWQEARERSCSISNLISHCVDYTIANEIKESEPQPDKEMRRLQRTIDASLFGAFLHNIVTLLYDAFPPLKELVWEMDLEDLTAECGHT